MRYRLETTVTVPSWADNDTDNLTARYPDAAVNVVTFGRTERGAADTVAVWADERDGWADGAVTVYDTVRGTATHYPSLASVGADTEGEW